jgi:hypothetical protein
MTRLRFTRGAFLVTAIALLVSAAAAGAAVPTGQATPYAAQLLSCHSSPRVAARSVAVATTMRPLGSGRRLLVRIDLQQRSIDGGRWTARGDVPGLGVWTSPSDPAIGSRPNDVFKYRQAVGRLVAPFQFRFRVGFRWLDADGDVVRSSATWTAACKQPELRPDLTIVRTRQMPDPLEPSAIRYSVLVRNQGVASAWNFDVAAQFPSADGSRKATPAQLRTVTRLAPQQTVWLAFTGPPCAAAAAGPVAPAFTADPANEIEESSETNNALTATCPPTAPPPVATLGRP